MRARGRNAYVGEIGLAYFARDLGAEFDPYPEATWVMSPQEQGQGFATEAIVRAHAWMVEHHDMKRSVCIVHPENTASLRVTSKLGYIQFGTADYRGAKPLMFERTD